MPEIIVQRWKDLGFKDRAQYVLSIILILSGIMIAFLSFFLTYDIATGVLIYIGQAFIAGGGLLGVSIYFRDKLREARGEMSSMITQAVEVAMQK